MGCDAHFHAARRFGQHEAVARCGPLIDAGRFGAAVGHDSGIDAVQLQPRVVDGAGLGKAGGAVEQAGIVVDRFANLGLVRFAREQARGFTAGEVVQQCVEQLARDQLGLEIGQRAVDDLRKGAHLAAGGLDAHALAPFAGHAFVVDEHKGLAQRGHGRALALENLRAAHGGEMVAQQVAVEFRRVGHAALDALGDVGAGGEWVFERQHRNADVVVCRGVGNDDVGAQQRRAVAVQQHAVELNDLGAPGGARLFRQVVENLIAAPTDQQRRRRGAAAFWNVGHVRGLGEADVVLK